MKQDLGFISIVAVCNKRDIEFYIKSLHLKLAEENTLIDTKWRIIFIEKVFPCLKHGHFERDYQNRIDQGLENRLLIFIVKRLF